MKRGLDAYRLKIIALFFMILDHVDKILSYPTHEYLNWPLLPEWISLITRFVSPLFLYLMIDGFYHTRSRKKFLIRLSIAAFIMCAGNTLIYLYFDKATISNASPITLLAGNNILLTLALMFALVWCMENIKNKNHRFISVLLALIIVVLSLLTGGGVFLLPTTIIIWGFYGRKNKQCIGIFVYSLILLIFTLYTHFTIDAEMGVNLYNRLCMDCEWAIFTVIPFILAYNGERGKNTMVTKYMFYVIYPAHLWLLTIARFLIMK